MDHVVDTATQRETSLSKAANIVACCAIVAMALTMPLPALADHSVTAFPPEAPTPPDFIFVGKESKTDDSRLNLWVTNSSGAYYRVLARAGSGNGSADDCATNQGWLPKGTYGRGDNDPKSEVTHKYKTTGNEVVRGHVWFLNSKRCTAGTKDRTELFIHSSGIEGTPWNNNWKSNGCIKVSQHARNNAGFTYYARAVAFQPDNERLIVYHQ